MKSHPDSNIVKNIPWKAGVILTGITLLSLLLSVQKVSSAQTPADLIQGLLDDKQSVRDQTFNTLKELDEDIAVSVLAEALEDEDWKVRVIAAYNLGQLGTETIEAKIELREALRDSKPEVRFSSAQALGKVGSVEEVSELVSMLSDEDKNVQFAAADTLLRLLPYVREENLRTLVTFLRGGNQIPLTISNPELDPTRSEHPENQSRWASQLSTYAYLEALGDGDWFIRQRAITELKRLLSLSDSNINYFLDLFDENEKALARREGVVSLKSSSNSGFRRSAIANLLLSVEKTRLIEVLKKSDSRYAIYLLGLTESPEAVSTLSTYWNASEDVYGSHSEYVEALGQIGNKEAISILISHLERDEGFGLYSKINPALAGKESEQLILEYIRLIQSENSLVRDQVVSFAAVGPKRYHPALITAIQRMDPHEASSILLSAVRENEISSNSPIAQRVRLGAAQLFSHIDSSIVKQQLSPEDAVGLFGEVILNGSSHNIEDEVVSLARDILTNHSSLLVSNLLPVLRENGDCRDEVPLLAYVAENGSEDAISGLIKILENKTLTERCSTSIASVLVEAGKKEGIPLLVERIAQQTLTHDKLYYSSQFITVLVKGGFEQEALAYLNLMLPEFIEYFQEPTVEKNKASTILWNLRETSLRESLPILRIALQNGYEISAIEALGEIGTKDDIPDMMFFMRESENYFIRERAVEATTKIVTSQSITEAELDNVISELTSSLEDEAWSVRLQSAKALKYIGSNTVPHLLEILKNDYSHLPALQVALQEINADRRRSAAFVLALIRDSTEPVNAELLTVVENENENIHLRWMAAAALSKSGGDTGSFFEDELLLSPGHLNTENCQDDHPVHDYLNSVVSFHIVQDIDFLYAGRCIFDDLSQSFSGGGGLAEWYNSFRRLVNRE